jgi:hypothetical protein
MEAWVRRLRRCERTTMEMHAAYERMAQAAGLPPTLRDLEARPGTERVELLSRGLSIAPAAAMEFAKAWHERCEAFEDEERHREQERQQEAAALAGPRRI